VNDGSDGDGGDMMRDANQEKKNLPKLEGGLCTREHRRSRALARNPVAYPQFLQSKKKNHATCVRDFGDPLHHLHH
jgi:hypothetical protein